MSKQISEDACLNCKISSRNSKTMKFHYIYDKIGIELQLNKLVEKYYFIKTDNMGGQQKLCNDCVNNLIELFDIEEYDKAVSAKTCANNADSVIIVESEQIHTDQEINSNPVDVKCNESDVKISDSENIFVVNPNNDIIPITKIDIDTLDDNEYVGHVVYEEPDPENAAISELQHAVLETEAFVQNEQLACNNEDSASVHILSDNSTNSYQFVSCNKNYADQDIITDTTSTLSEIINTNSGGNEVEDGNDIDDNIYMEEALEEEDTITNTGSAISDDLIILDDINTHSFDCVDVNDYLDMVLTTKFEDLELKWSTKCKICSLKFEMFQALLTHDCVNQSSDEEHHNLSCFIGDCLEEFANKPLLARHMILRHYPELNRLKIYGSCPECNWRFSNFLHYNKHSCCHYLRRKPGCRNTCKSCKLDFFSLKRYVFHMQFHLAKYRPKICFICGEQFNNPNDLFEHVHYDHEHEKTMACIKCDRFFQDEHSFKSHLRTHETKSIFQCTYCHRNFHQRHNLMSHLEIYHNYKTKQIQCEYCDKAFVGNVSYRNHMKFHLPEAEVYGYVCAECGLVAAEGDILKKHAERDEASTCYDGTICEQILSVVYTCENCYMDFTSIIQLQQHRSSSIHNDNVFRCIFCERCFDTYKQMRNHMKSHKQYENWLANFPICRLYICNIGNCDEAYPLWTSLYYHKKRPHHKDKDENDDFKCQFCHKECPTKMSLAVHVARSHNNKNVKCSLCKNSYKDDKTLQEHINYMHTPIECKKCYKIIKNRRNYDTHERIVHQNTQRYFCSVCERGFYHKSEMEYHEKNIHAKVIFECNLCEFKTAYHKSLDIHIAKHNNQKNYKCRLCSKAFTRQHVLNSHFRRHHDKKEFVCNERIENGCNAAYISFGELRKHAEKKHNYIFEGMPKRPRYHQPRLNTKEKDNNSKRELPLNKKESTKRQRRKLAVENAEGYLIQIQHTDDDDADAISDNNDDDENIFELYESNLIDDKASEDDNQGNIAGENNDDNVDIIVDGDDDDDDGEAKEDDEHCNSIELILQNVEFDNDNVNDNDNDSLAYSSRQYINEFNLEFK